MATFIHNILNIDQAPKLLKDQIKMNLIVHKGGYNLRNKFQVNQPLRIIHITVNLHLFTFIQNL
jgi:hypothetical protein